MEFLKSRAQEHNLQCQTLVKNMLWGWTFKAFKTSGNWGSLIKRPSGRQGVKNEWSCTTTPPICLYGVGADSFAHFPFTFTVMQELTTSCGMWSLRRGSDQTDWADHNRWPQHFTSTHNFHGVMLNYRKGIALLYVRFEVLTALLLKMPVFWDTILCFWWDGSWWCRPSWHLCDEDQGEGPMFP